MKTKKRKIFRLNENQKDVIICLIMGICFFTEIYVLIWFCAIINT